jgi:hypothetical protein
VSRTKQMQVYIPDSLWLPLQAQPHGSHRKGGSIQARDVPQALVARSGVMVEDNQKVRILEPNAIRQKRMEARKFPRKWKSTQRVPSHFERVDKNHPACRPAALPRICRHNFIQVPTSQPFMHTPIQKNPSKVHSMAIKGMYNALLIIRDIIG